jgi:hypothetical protein
VVGVRSEVARLRAVNQEKPLGDVDHRTGDVAFVMLYAEDRVGWIQGECSRGDRRGQHGAGEIIIVVRKVAQALASQEGNVVDGIVKELYEHLDLLMGQFAERNQLCECGGDTASVSGWLADLVQGKVQDFRVPTGGYRGDHGRVQYRLFRRYRRLPG